MRGSNARIVVGLALVWPWLVSCQSGDPVERVAAARAEYEISHSSWLAREAEVPDEVEATDGEGAMPAAEEDGGSLAEEVGEALEYAEGGARPTSVLFDVVLRQAGDEALPGITLDIVHKDPFGEVKEERRHYVETAGMRRNSARQVSFVLEDWSFEAGDEFQFELRNVAPEERGEYREFREAS